MESERQTTPPPAKAKGPTSKIPLKPQKPATLPKMTKPMPVVAKIASSVSLTSQTTEGATNRSKQVLDSEAVSSKAAEEKMPAVELDLGVEQAPDVEADPPSPRLIPVAMKPQFFLEDDLISEECMSKLL